MINNRQQTINKLHDKGQSLVEIALFLPIFLVIIAGLVEVSNILVTQNSIHNATRVGTRFGSNGGQDEGMVLSVQNAVTEVLDLEEGYWDMWSIRGKVNEDGNDFEDWEFVHVFGEQQTQVFTNVVEADIREQVLENLQTDDDGNTPSGIAGDLAFVGMYVGHDIDSILGLNVLEELAGINSVKSLSVMRKNGVEDVVTEGCTAFPIAVDENIRSVAENTDAENRWRTDFDYPSPPPNYLSYIDHRPEISFLEAREGYLYNIQNGASSGGKGWLAWNECVGSATDLQGSLEWPGNSNDHTPIPGSCNGGPKFEGFMEAGDNTDLDMHVDDWVAVSTGNINSGPGRDILQDHMEIGRNLRVIVYNQTNGQTGSNSAYLISRFAIMRLIGYRLSGNESFIMAEFIRWDNSCGQDTQITP